MNVASDRLVSLFKVGLTVSAVLCWSSRALCQRGVTATITDTAGVSTEVSELESDQKRFATYDVDGSGFQITTKEFPISRRFFPGELGGSVVRWVYFSKLASLTFDAKRNATAELRDGTSMKGKVVEWWAVRGKLASGTFELQLSKVNSLKVTNAPAPPETVTEGSRAVVELRDGEQLTLNDPAMYQVVDSGYVNVPSYKYMDRLIWIQVKRGQGSVKMEIPFERIASIQFERPAVTAGGFEGYAKIKVSLADGSVLSGACGGDGERERCNALAGVTADGPVVIDGNKFGLGYALSSVTFAE
jgi:hypothetical protein